MIYNGDMNAQVKQFISYCILFILCAVLFSINIGTPDKYDVYMVIRIAILYTLSLHYYEIYRNQLNQSTLNNFTIKENFYYMVFNGGKLIIIMGIAFVILYSYTAYAIQKNPDIPLSQERGNEFKYVIRSIIVSPVWKELLCRGIFYNLFFKGGSKRDNMMFLFSSSLVFTLFHSQPPNLTTLYYFLISMLLAISYLWTKNIKYAMILHAFINYMNPVVVKLILVLPY